MLFISYTVSIKALLTTLAVEIGIVLFTALLISASKRKKERVKKEKVENILDAIHQAGLEEYINNFITRFGLGQEKSKNVWVRRNYKISWDRINDLKDFLYQKGINFSSSEIGILLANYIDKREFDLTVNTISTNTSNFSKLSGTDFEHLLYRLYEAMDYSVLASGRVGD